MAKVLIVDDDEALRRLMRLELSDAYEVIDSGEPEQGLALALDHKSCAILLDLRMPKYSGYELLQTFTSFSCTQMVPVIIVSGEAGGQTKEHCKQLGAAGYFEKPIDFDALRACLQQLIKTRRYTPRRPFRREDRTLGAAVRTARVRFKAELREHASHPRFAGGNTRDLEARST
jgi:two-component system, OmpR family, response regulator